MRSLTNAIVLAAGLASLPSPAAAQQPLGEFLRAATGGGALDIQEAELEAETARAQVDEARARLLPSLAATASYTRNQYEAVAEIPGVDPTTMMIATQRAVITPFDQLEARFTLSVPLLDVAAWSSLFGAEVSADAAVTRVEASSIDARAAVITAYYQLVAARAVRDAAARTLTASEENLAVVEARVTAGLASELDRQRAISDVERSRQSGAEADLSEALAIRSLYVATALQPTDARVTLADDLGEEPPLDVWLEASESMPAVRAASSDVRAAELQRDAAWQALLPTIAANASELLTNATGFTGQNTIWSVGAIASWTLDFGRPAAVGTRERQVSSARVRVDRARQAAETAIYESWHRVRSLIARARASRASEAASERAAEVARARFEAGTGTQLEVSQSERDLFAAEVARIQADADLRVARLALRLRSGLQPELEGAGQ